MALYCPSCDGEVLGDSVEVAEDLATCPHCEERFAPSEVLAGVDTSVDAPPPTVAQVDYPPDGGIQVSLPPKGLHGHVVSVFIFAGFSNLIVVVVGGGFFLKMLKGEMPWLLCLFFLPFVMAGVGMTWWGCRMAWGSERIELGPGGFVITRRLFGRERCRAYDLADVEPFCRGEAYQVNGRSLYQCASRVGRKLVKFGGKLSDPDQEWLVAELNRVLGQIRPAGR